MPIAVDFPELPPELPKLLLQWYDRHARILPWRENPTPYRVWISEIMLQQTRVETVKPYFNRFLNALPDLRALAGAPEEQLLKLWEGLGYYSRVRNLQRAAQRILTEFDGEFPADPVRLRQLPGIGDYTAGAIASISFGLPEPAVDGNVLRALARLTGWRGDTTRPAVKTAVGTVLRDIYPRERAGDFTQSLMELGALICVPGGPPQCDRCPLCRLCRCARSDAWREIPTRPSRRPRVIEELTVLLLRCGDRVALRRRPATGLLAGMWEFPTLPGRLSAEEAAAELARLGTGRPIMPVRELTARHVFTHREWHMTGYCFDCPTQLEPFTWATSAALHGEFALPSAFAAFRPLLPPSPDTPESV